MKTYVFGVAEDGVTVKTQGPFGLTCQAMVPMLLVAALAQSPNTGEALKNLNPVPFTQVTISDSFWAPRRLTNRTVSLTHSLDMLEKAGNLKDFELAAQGKHEGYMGPVFMDSDLYKTLEAVSYSLATDPDPVLENRIDGMIAKIAAAQMADGYLNTYYQVNEPDKRFTNLAWNHELYCAGHLFEAAVAHHQATKKTTLLNVATKYADFLAKTFGDGPGQRPGYGGHPEIELALVKLWKDTGKQDYFKLAQFFIDHRGEHFFAREQHVDDSKYDGNYYQDQVPIRNLKGIVGHAVRAGYLMSGAADVARETHDKGLLAMLDRVWTNTVGKNMYITGGIGPSASNEGFTFDYDLPNLTAYQETCASVAMTMWNHRLAMLHGQSKYADVMETSLYNGVLAGYSLDGQRYFYVNPLASLGNHHRSEWFGCACCPPNEARTLAALGGYAYATSDNALWLNLYIQGTVKTQVDGSAIGLDVKTDYPWDGDIRIKVHSNSKKSLALNLRIPGWAQNPSVTVNGSPQSPNLNGTGYWTVSKIWAEGDVVELKLPMPVRQVAANPQVKDDIGKLAIMRGPLVYCLEQVDNPVPLNSVAIPQGTAWKAIKQAGLLGGVVTLDCEGVTASQDRWDGGLYGAAPTPKPVKLRAIPYYAWDNRAAGAMSVWMPTSPLPPTIGGLEIRAKVSMSFVSGNAQPGGINDGIEPKSSGEQPASLAHWWPHKGGKEWIQYDWSAPVKIGSIQVYWFDDSGRGECRLPKSWHLETMVDGHWAVVKSDYPVKKDGWCQVEFEPLATKSLRLVVDLQEGWAAGIHEWRVWEPEN